METVAQQTGVAAIHKNFGSVEFRCNVAVVKIPTTAKMKEWKKVITSPQVSTFILWQKGPAHLHCRFWKTTRVYVKRKWSISALKWPTLLEICLRWICDVNFSRYMIWRVIFELGIHKLTFIILGYKQKGVFIKIT